MDQTVSFPQSSSTSVHMSLLGSEDLFFSASCPSNRAGTQWQLIGCGSLNKELLCLGSGHDSKHNLVCLWLQLPHIVKRRVCEPHFRSPLLPGPGTLSPFTPSTPPLRPGFSPEAPCSVRGVMSDLSSCLFFFYDS